MHLLAYKLRKRADNKNTVFSLQVQVFFEFFFILFDATYRKFLFLEDYFAGSRLMYCALHLRLHTMTFLANRS
jgi:hypothetical protein